MALSLLLVACVGEAGSSSDASTNNDGGSNSDAAGGADGSIDANTDPFSFFVTSYATMQLQPGSVDGFGGNLGGLAGADQICQTAAANVGFNDRTWRAFLSVTDDGNGNPVHAIDRIGTGPWYDRSGRLIANDLTGLVMDRPDGDPQAVEDLNDENAVPISDLGNAHDTITGSDGDGRLFSTDPDTTCLDWTSDDGTVGDDPGGGLGTVRAGHSYPRGPGQAVDWISEHNLRGCAPGVNFVNNGSGSGNCIGCTGGFGGIYCFAIRD